MKPNTFKDFVDNAIAVLQSDGRHLGLAVEGSWTRGQLDEFSDLDLIIVSAPGDEPDLAAMRALAERLGPLVSVFTGEHVGEPRLLICLYQLSTLAHVDLKFTTLEGLARRSADPEVVWERDSALSRVIADTEPTPLAPDYQWIEDRIWTWVHYAALRLGRGEVFDLVSFLGFLRERVLGPMALHANGCPPFGVRRIEEHAPEFARRLETTVPVYDLLDCHPALLATVALYRELREPVVADLTVNAVAETESLRYLGDVAARCLPGSAP